jgi:hypothetical protein
MTIPSASNGSVELGFHNKQISSTKPTNVSSGKKDQQNSEIDIIDIRHDATEMNIKEEISRLLQPERGPKKLPTLLLYDERGLQIFEKARPIYLFPAFGCYLILSVDYIFGRILFNQC